MALNLADSQRVRIRDMTLSNCPPTEMTDVVGYSERSVFAIQSNRRHFGIKSRDVWRYSRSFHMAASARAATQSFHSPSHLNESAGVMLYERPGQ